MASLYTTVGRGRLPTDQSRVVELFLIGEHVAVGVRRHREVPLPNVLPHLIQVLRVAASRSGSIATKPLALPVLAKSRGQHRGQHRACLRGISVTPGPRNHAGLRHTPTYPMRPAGIEPATSRSGGARSIP